VVSYNGKCDKLGSLETAAQNAGFEALVLNHAHVVATLKPLKSADVKGAAAEIKLVDGVQGVTSGPSGLELHADLEKLTMENLRTAVAKYNCEIIVNQTFEYVRYAVTQGEAWEYVNAADLVKGVMIAREDEAGVVGMWINKAQVKLDKLEKMEGFKVERK
jgi:hypothetical protein